ncbi:OTU deubiquitinase with linear linkage specificity a [Pholidichthys leucotaenia]
MSWFKAVSFSGDDVFDETADDLHLQSKEWTNNMRRRVRDGYVDGATAGEEASLQEGFNQGFREGATQTVVVGRLKGIISAIWCWFQIQHPENPIPASVTDLEKQVREHEDRIIEGLRHSMKNPPSVSDVSESMEDLGVGQPQPGCSGEGCKESDCCKRPEQMDLDAPRTAPKLCSGSTNCSRSSDEDLHHLMQCCVDVVSELGLPQELVGHIEELRDIK